MKQRNKYLIIALSVIAIVIIGTAAAILLPRYLQERKINQMVSQIQTSVINQTKETLDKATEISKDAEAMERILQEIDAKCKNEGKLDLDCARKVSPSPVGPNPQLFQSYSKLSILRQETKMIFCEKSQAKFDELLKIDPNWSITKKDGNWWSEQRATLRNDLVAAMNDDKKNCHKKIDLEALKPLEKMLGIAEGK